MSLVSLRDKHRALQLVGGGSPAHDRLLLSLANRTTWTHNQRALIDKIVRERQPLEPAAVRPRNRERRR